MDFYNKSSLRRMLRLLKRTLTEKLPVINYASSIIYESTFSQNHNDRPYSYFGTRIVIKLRSIDRLSFAKLSFVDSIDTLEE